MGRYERAIDRRRPPCWQAAERFVQNSRGSDVSGAEAEVFAHPHDPPPSPGYRLAAPLPPRSALCNRFSVGRGSNRGGTTFAAVNSLTPSGSRLAFVRVMSLNFHERQPGVQIAVGAGPSVLHRDGGGGPSQTRGAASPLRTGSLQVPESRRDRLLFFRTSR